MKFLFLCCLFFIVLFRSVTGRKFLAKRGEHVLIDICVHCFFLFLGVNIEAGACVNYPLLVDTYRDAAHMYILVE